MATVNLGRIKPVFRGAYDNSTAYVIDDIVTSGNETFIAIAATQGNATSDASKWTKLAAKGTDGSAGDSFSLANKEIAFKTNAGALDGIPIGNAGEFLKVNSGATGYEFGAVSSDWVKLYSAEDVSAASEINLNGYFDATKYHVYKILYSAHGSSGGNSFLFRARTGTNGANEDTSNNYYYAYTFRSVTSGGQTQSSHGNGFGDSARMGWSGGGGLQSQCCHQLTIHRPDDNDTTHVEVSGSFWDNSYFGHVHGAWVFNANNTPMTGIKLFHGGGNIGLHYVNIYGLKK